MLDLGADPLVAIEPDPAIAAYLEKSCPGPVETLQVALEHAHLPAGTFDLAVAASSFHWIEEDVGLAKIFEALRPKGWLVIWWTLFGDGEPDAFIAATTPLLEDLSARPTRGEEGRPPHALDVEARLQALQTAGFEDGQHEVARWRASWDTEGIRALYGTFSPIARLDDGRRKAILDGVARIAERDFGSRVERTLVTSLYTARRPQ